MKTQQCSFSCDRCYADSPPESLWSVARKTAKAEGWSLEGLQPEGADLCPQCVEDVDR